MILYVLRYYPTLTETFVHDEIRGLAERGYDVQIAAFDPRGDPGVAPLALPTHPQPHRARWLGALPALFAEWLRAPTPIRASSAIAAGAAGVSLRILWLAALLRRLGTRHVHVHFAGEAAEWARLACRRVGIPYSVTTHAVDLFKPRPALKQVFRDASTVVTISHHNERILDQTYQVPCEIVRYGIRTQMFSRGPDPSPPVLLAVGRWVPKKGFDLLLEAMMRVDRALLLRLVSEPPSLPPPEALGQVRIEVLGLRPHAEIPALLHDASVFVLPCRQAPDGDMDGIPVSILEAMASGLPVITCAVSGIPELLDDEVGWVLQPDDLDGLVAAIRAAVDDPAEARRRGERGKERLVQRGYTLEVQVGRMVSIFTGAGSRG